MSIGLREKHLVIFVLRRQEPPPSSSTCGNPHRFWVARSWNPRQLPARSHVEHGPASLLGLGLGIGLLSPRPASDGSRVAHQTSWEAPQGRKPPTVAYRPRLLSAVGLS